MKIACCIWALSLPETELLRQVSELGFSFIDIQPGQLRALESRLLAQELGLSVSCLGASFGMPAGASLDSADDAAREAASNHASESIAQAAEVDADTVYIVPGKDESAGALERYAKSMTALADAARDNGLKLAIEHFPGTALPSANATLEFIHGIGNANLYLLIDTGHLQMSGEDPASAIVNAGERLAYVHFDDNDGFGDLHWSLLDGVMTEESLDATLGALQEIGYQGALSLELSPSLKQPAKALRDSRDTLLTGAAPAAVARRGGLKSNLRLSPILIILSAGLRGGRFCRLRRNPLLPGSD